VSADITPLARVCVEASVSRVIGRELTDNPYDSLNAPQQHSCWAWAWRYTDHLLERVVEQEVAGWVEDEAA
jgi:hypothetical protein